MRVGTEPFSDGGAEAFVARLAEAGSDFGRQLRRLAPGTLREALAGCVAVDQGGPGNPHRETLARAMASVLTLRGEPPGEAERVATWVLRTPVIQQGDHSNLLLDPETFLNNWLHFLGCRELGHEYMLVSQCSTVSCLSRRDPVAGPVFLYTRHGLAQVFSHSRRQLKHAHFCLLPDAGALTFRALSGSFPDPSGDALLGGLLDVRADGPAALYRRCNDALWSALRIDHGVRRVAFDESLASEILARHLQQDGPVARLFFDPGVRSAFLEEKRRYVETRSNLGINKALPDFLWVVQGTRLHPVRWAGDGPRVEESKAPRFDAQWAPRTLAEGLRDGRLFASRFMAYLVRCLLPEAVAIGGSVQQDYVAGYREILQATHARTGFLSARDLEAVRREDTSRLGGRPLLEPTRELHDAVQELDGDTDLDALAEVFLDQTVGRTVGSLHTVRFYDQILQRAAQGKA